MKVRWNVHNACFHSRVNRVCTYIHICVLYTIHIVYVYIEISCWWIGQIWFKWNKVLNCTVMPQTLIYRLNFVYHSQKILHQIVWSKTNPSSHRQHDIHVFIGMHEKNVRTWFGTAWELPNILYFVSDKAMTQKGNDDEHIFHITFERIWTLVTFNPCEYVYFRMHMLFGLFMGTD